MICELCRIEDNYDDSKGEIVMVGLCGGCHEAVICHKCIDKHQDTCIGWLMIIKDQHILQ